MASCGRKVKGFTTSKGKRVPGFTSRKGCPGYRKKVGEGIRPKGFNSPGAKLARARFKSIATLCHRQHPLKGKRGAAHKRVFNSLKGCFRVAFRQARTIDLGKRGIYRRRK